MSTLQTELDRLYLSHDTEPSLIAHERSVRAMVLELARPADWTLLSTVWRGVQTDFELPAPAIAVSGIDAYQLWFSLAEPVSVAQAGAFLESLRLRYLSQVAAGRLSMRPFVDPSSPDTIQHALLVPALHQATGHWSAFVAPDLAAIFAEEPWLDLPPNPDAQANVLSRLQCIKPAVFHVALEQMSSAVRAKAPLLTSITDGRNESPTGLNVTTSVSRGNSLEPKGFLLDVMNDKTVELHLRIDAAKALLPYFEGRCGS